MRGTAIFVTIVWLISAWINRLAGVQRRQVILLPAKMPARQGSSADGQAPLLEGASAFVVPSEPARRNRGLAAAAESLCSSS